MKRPVGGPPEARRVVDPRQGSWSLPGPQVEYAETGPCRLGPKRSVEQGIKPTKSKLVAVNKPDLYMCFKVQSKALVQPCVRSTKVFGACEGSTKLAQVQTETHLRLIHCH